MNSDSGSPSPATAEPARPTSAAESLLLEVKALAMRLRQSSAAGEGGVVPDGGLQVLLLLEQHGPQSVPVLARRRCTSRQNVQILVNRLAAEGCIQKAGNPAHKRSALVQLTSRGKAVLEASILREQAIARSLISALGHTELSESAQLLRRIRQLLMEYAAAAEAPAQHAPQVRRLGPPPRPTLEGLPLPSEDPAPGQSPLELPVNLL